MSKLIIAEKPSVAKSIASALGASSRADGFYSAMCWRRARRTLLKISAP